MMDMDIFQLLYNHLEERHYNNICQNAKQDANYLKATVLENELNAEYEKLDLSDEQQNVIMQWIDAIHAQEAAYTVVAFRMGVQCCFSLLMQLANLQLHKKSAVFQNFLGLGIPLILCFNLVVKGIFFSSLIPLVSAIFTWTFWIVKKDVTKLLPKYFNLFNFSQTFFVYLFNIFTFHTVTQN